MNSQVYICACSFKKNLRYRLGKYAHRFYRKNLWRKVLTSKLSIRYLSGLWCIWSRSFVFSIEHNIINIGLFLAKSHVGRRLLVILQVNVKSIPKRNTLYLIWKCVYLLPNLDLYPPPWVGAKVQGRRLSIIALSPPWKSIPGIELQRCDHFVESLVYSFSDYPLSWSRTKFDNEAGVMWGWVPRSSLILAEALILLANLWFPRSPSFCFRFWIIPCSSLTLTTFWSGINPRCSS